MKAKKIKFWARIGQISYFVYKLFVTLVNRQLPGYIPIELSGTTLEFVYVNVYMFAAILFSNAIVEILGYFAELLEGR